MYVSSRLTTGLVFAVVLAIALWTFGVPSLQATAAQDSCQICPQKPTPPQSCLTCPVDPKEVKKAEKEAAHAQHEAEEEQARAQKEAAHAQHEAAEDCARRQKALAHAQHEADEAREKLAAREATVNELGGCCKSEPVAEKEVEIERTKP